jgi:hypothetical protein
MDLSSPGKLQVVSWVDRGAEKWKLLRTVSVRLTEVRVPASFGLQHEFAITKRSHYAAVLEDNQTVIFEFTSSPRCCT